MLKVVCNLRCDDSVQATCIFTCPDRKQKTYKVSKRSVYGVRSSAHRVPNGQKFKSEKNKNKEQLTIFPRRMRIFSIWKVKKRGRKVAPTKFPLISSTDGRTDRQTYYNSLLLTSAEKSTSINQAHPVLSFMRFYMFCKELKIIGSPRI